jgi:pimeloyl-ACP methyl ester carboxylesterase
MCFYESHTAMNHYTFNSAPGKPIINLSYANGFPPETYARALQPLFKDYQVQSIHLRPLQGDTEPESLKRWTQFGDDLLEGLDELTDQPVIGIGHSVGAVATMYAAIMHPERFSKLVLIEPTMLSPILLLMLQIVRMSGLNPRVGRIEGALRRRRNWESKQAAFDNFKEKRLFQRWPEDVLWSYVESMTAPDQSGGVSLTWSPEWEAQIYRTLPTGVWSLPRKLKTPTLVIRGDLTETFTATSARIFKVLRPNTQMAIIKGAGHLIPQEKPDEVGKLIAEYLAL